MIDRFEKFSLAISEISRYWRKLTADEMGKYGLKGSHSVYLLTMLKYPEGITSLKLCELCRKDKSDVSRMMPIMEKEGLISKESIYQNFYGAKFKLTEQGEIAAKQIRERASSAVEFAGKNLTEEKRKSFYESLDIIVCNLRELSKEGIPK